MANPYVGENSIYIIVMNYRLQLKKKPLIIPTKFETFIDIVNIKLCIYCISNIAKAD